MTIDKAKFHDWAKSVADECRANGTRGAVYLEGSDALELLGEIERLESRVTILQKYEDECLRLVREAEAERDQLKAENEALRKDAERYRYVRDCAYGVATIDGYRIMFEAPMPEGPFTGSAEKLDLAVDTDMSQEAGHD